MISSGQFRLLTIEDGRLLSRLARKAFTGYLKGEPAGVPSTLLFKFNTVSGVFVSVIDSAKARIICIGFPLPTCSLAQALVDASTNAAIRADLMDYGHAENDLRLEVSILSELERIDATKAVDYPKILKIGRDGIMVEHGLRRGILLPQLISEQGWNAEDALTECCLRAGLPYDCWLSGKARVYRFQATIFMEKDPGGEIVMVLPTPK